MIFGSFIESHLKLTHKVNLSLQEDLHDRCENKHHSSTTMLEQYESDFWFTKDTPYLALTVYCEEFGEHWPRYNGIALYLFLTVQLTMI